ncbi:MAG: 1-deoxy-D-xylulose-5-phosphate synthase [Magnetococcales bacterium]|nr:1-deoxy-D-xylulose-5-phosphate synthase [Magnetococcales bacterium]
MTAQPKLMRDIFVDAAYQTALKNRDLFFLSADFGAKALDAFRRDLPDNFVFTGIAEQNLVDIGAGLALCGKQVICYAMAPFITARCYEQTKCVIAAMHLPVTFVAVGVGLGYDHAALTHFTPEDLAIMKAQNGIEILTPCDEESATAMTHLALEWPAFRYLRLERRPQPPVYHGRFTPEVLEAGCAEVVRGKDVGIVSCGFLVHKALKARELLAAKGIDAGVVDLFRIKPVNAPGLAAILDRYPALVTVEEQLLEGGFGSAVTEVMADQGILKRLKRLGIQDRFVVVNGNRDYLHNLYGVDTPHIVAAAEALV